jgi:hypothetical protein
MDKDCVEYVHVIRSLYRAAATSPEYIGVERFCENLKVVKKIIEEYLEDFDGSN